ncbi:DER1-domain-containing protein [Neocallimastix lanati (nom. inval.)]|jgi:hypothetical protein|uniref:Derlin n=1 Tax=Neocallimastix californiae TaxID=1754190 RepID=A0A1Y2FMS4_9FUNG|nr:DER1-domain-containing protein [Neocallimastix sp. JGI-2020a]ORY85229.1 DER1-domain-containing protein [Neocallimastix californiae]|eukprot:ORY85229.1 DER1-domain-containing protein [Neocallimastix californiae]
MNEENNESFLVKIRDWYTGIPFVTRCYMTMAFSVPIFMEFGLVTAKTIALIGPAVYEKLQIWRLFTHFFVNKLGFGFLMNLFFLYQSLTSLENGKFYGRKADYVWFFIFGMLIFDFIAIKFSYFFLPGSLMFYIIYYWSQCNRDQNVSFMFGFQFKAVYFPFVLIAFGLLSGGGLDKTQLFGIAVGHLYYFLKDIWPNQYEGREFIATPSFIKKLFPEDIQEEPPQVNNDGRHKWGSGYKLN